MLRIRLQRVGRKHDPSFRLVLTDRRNGPQSGKFLELLGSYNARGGKTVIKSDRVKHWMQMGAQISDTVNNLLIKEKVIEGKTINVLPKKTPIVKDVVKEDIPAGETEKPAVPSPQDNEEQSPDSSSAESSKDASEAPVAEEVKSGETEENRTDTAIKETEKLAEEISKETKEKEEVK